MKIYFDLNHPVHYHTLKKLIARLGSNGHFCFVSLRNKDVLIELVKQEGMIMNYRIKGKGSVSKTGRIIQMLFWNLKNMLWALKYKPDLLVGFASPYMSLASLILRKPLILIDDTEIDTTLQKVYLPFVSKLITPACFTKDLGKNQVRLNFLKELSYLSSGSKLQTHKQLNILVRFTSAKALHDSSFDKLTEKNKKEIVEKLSRLGNVYISSEDSLSESLSNHELKIPPHKMHDFMQNQMDVFVGESATMAAEAAVLGKISIYIDNQTRGYIGYLESEYALVKHYTKLDSSKIIKYIREQLQEEKLTERIQQANLICDQHIDLTDYLYSFLLKNKKGK